MFQISALGEVSTNQGSSNTNSGGIALLDTVERDIRLHIGEIEGKIVTIVDSLLAGQISTWAIKPPVPSQSFRNISRSVI